MERFRLEQVQSQQMRQEMRQILRMEQADMLEMPEGDFHKLVSDIERSPLFRRLRRQKLVGYRKPPRTGISSGFFQLKDDLIAGSAPADVETLLQGKERILSVVREIGQEKFKRYFLFPDEAVSNDAIARECGLSPGEIQQINDLIDKVSVLSEFSHCGGPQVIRYACVASIERDAGGLVIGYQSTHLARGRYSVDYAAFDQALSSFTEDEAKEARRLFKKLELINSRKDTLTRILQGIIEKQAVYLESGEAKSLLPLTQGQFAVKLGMAPSSVSRAIRGKSVVTPAGKEVPLKYFFPPPKKFKQELLRQVLESGEKATDEAIRARLRERFGVAISRRSVASLRQELKLPASRRRLAGEAR